jgi:uncharacterized membrane protein
MRHHFGRVDYLQILIILIVFVSSFIVYNNATGDQFITHWDRFGNPDSFAPKSVVLFLFPIIILVCYTLFLLVPYISHHDNLEDFYKTYGGFRLAMILFLAIVYYSIIMQNFNFRLNVNYIVIPSFAAIFYYFGHVLSVSNRNHYIGFRNPWTSDSDFVWKKTHDLGGLLFKGFAVFSLLALVFPQCFFLFIVVPLILIILIIIFYSRYVHTHYQRIIREKDEHVLKLKEKPRHILAKELGLTSVFPAKEQISEKTNPVNLNSSKINKKVKKASKNKKKK